MSILNNRKRSRIHDGFLGLLQCTTGNKKRGSFCQARKQTQTHPHCPYLTGSESISNNSPTRWKLFSLISTSATTTPLVRRATGKSVTPATAPPYVNRLAPPFKRDGRQGFWKTAKWKPRTPSLPDSLLRACQIASFTFNIGFFFLHFSNKVGKCLWTSFCLCV